MPIQAPSAVVMIRPHFFRANEATAADNSFQSEPGENHDGDAVATAAYREVTVAVERLRAEGVTVLLFEDMSRETPDSVFPNNWFSTHAGGRIAVFPMFVPNRRIERRWDIIETLKAQYRVQEVVDYSGLEVDDIFLEGTGAMVLDYGAHLAYVARSNRANPIALERFCTQFGFEPMAFDAHDENGDAIYHTNVMMCIGTDVALIGLETIADQDRRDEVAERLSRRGRRTVIPLTHRQLRGFAGNAMELSSPKGRLMAMSTTALATLTDEQCATIERTTRIVPIDIPTIETAGGSVRCMLAGILLERRRRTAGGKAAATRP
ncbi:MAG: amidinotransferase [Acidobacteria bacterium]|nr:amidinotransferase [Thermoanaerobaculia bacterium]NLN12543.1 amidinotransferase [Acidobacteriota bacterium]MBP7812581.1 amidinotransferase [Thermoanaerobaculia bacterium]MBP8846033.1 amidinotransferase [Thermoanaerobaculia bacterium]HPA95070.1 arginine deiminase-related protein [Thermoanaerobaculia bacterium]